MCLAAQRVRLWLETRTTPRFLLLGSGEFLPWSEEAERYAIGPTPAGPVAVLPTASAPEGDEVFHRWGRMALTHYAVLGLPARLVEVKTRDDCAAPDRVNAIDEAGMVFFSGGNPVHLARILDGTPLMDAIHRALARGAVYAGCSAGAMVAGARAARSTRRGFRSAGLGLVEHVRFGVHWNRVPSLPGVKRFMTAGLEAEDTFVGIDEMTAIVGDAAHWRVFGSGQVEVRGSGESRFFRAGDEFSVG